MKTIFNLAEYPSLDLDRLEMGINSGIVDATHCGQIELVETLETFRLVVKLARKEAAERESQEFATEATRDIIDLFSHFKGLKVGQ